MRQSFHFSRFSFIIQNQLNLVINKYQYTFDLGKWIEISMISFLSEASVPINHHQIISISKILSSIEFYSTTLLLNFGEERKRMFNYILFSPTYHMDEEMLLRLSNQQSLNLTFSSTLDDLMLKSMKD